MSSEQALEAREVKALKADAHQVIVIGNDNDDESPPAVRIELADVSELHEDETNARRGNVESIDGSLAEFGQHRFVVAQRDGRIVVGNHLYRTARQRGWNKVFVQWVDDDNLKGTRRGLADNATGDLARWDLGPLMAIHDEIGIEDVPGFDMDRLEELRQQHIAEHERQQEEDNAEGAEAPQDPLSYDIYPQQEIIDDAFAHFREAGFPYRALTLHECKQQINKLAAMDDDALAHSTLAYQVADTFNPHRFHATAEKMVAPVESFKDDVKLKKALRLCLDSGGTIKQTLVAPMLLVNGTQACANFRPAFAALMYRRYAGDDAVVLDTSTGYGGRLVGAIATKSVAHYIGIDPNTQTHESNQKLTDALGGATKVTLINSPAEDVDPDSVGSCDFAFTSPPYFRKEHYADEDTQSFKRYPKADAWRKGFLQKMLALQFNCLKSGANNVVNIADVKIGKTTHPLVEWTIDDALALGFELAEQYTFDLSVRFGANMEEEQAQEAVLVFRRP